MNAGHRLTFTVEVKAVCHDKPCTCEVGMGSGQLRYLSWYQGAFFELPADLGKEDEALSRVTALLMGMPEFDEETWSTTAPLRVEMTEMT